MFAGFNNTTVNIAVTPWEVELQIFGHQFIHRSITAPDGTFTKCGAFI